MRRPARAYPFVVKLARWRRTSLVVLGLLAGAVTACNAWVLVRGGPRVVAPRDARHAQAAIVFGAGVHADGTVSEILADRLQTAVELYRDGRVDALVLTGDHASPEYDEVDAMRRFVVARGVPDSALVVDPYGVDTFSSVARAKRVYGVDRAIMVSQGYHLPRAIFVGESLGIAAEGVAADRRSYRAMGWFRAREVLSRCKAVLDVASGRAPRLDR
jgi:vancomycin permeability regulator SanA